ncbi:MAG: TRC40/GET3/ArsA family transport-energizing ATPase [Methanoregula sp.]
MTPHVRSQKKAAEKVRASHMNPGKKAETYNSVATPRVSPHKDSTAAPEQSFTRIILFGGKGGVGKTSAAAATALSLSNAGERVLIISSDPAPSLSDIFECPVGGTVTEIKKNLYAIEINADAVLEKYKKIYGSAIIDALATIIPIQEDILEDLPGTVVPGFDELFALEELLTFLPDGYDHIIWDTAPTGHTLRLLTLPDSIVGYSDGMQKIEERLSGIIGTVRVLFNRESNKESLGRALLRLKSMAQRALSILTDHDRTEFVLVIIPEALALFQTERMKQVLDSLDILTSRIIVNGLIPENTCPFCISRRNMQQRYLTMIRERYESILTVVEVPLFPGELKGQDTLKEYARYLGQIKESGQREAAERM